MKPTTISTLSQFPKHGCSICGNEHIYDPRPIHVYYQRLLNAKDLEADKNGYERGRKEADEAIKERDLAREMLLTDQTHASCDVFQKKQQRKLDEAADLLELSRKDVTKLEAGRINKRIEKFLAEAQKLLADSGGEKEKSE